MSETVGIGSTMGPVLYPKIGSRRDLLASPPPWRMGLGSFRSACLMGPDGRSGIFVNIDGPRRFRRIVARGLRLEAFGRGSV